MKGCGTILSPAMVLMMEFWDSFSKTVNDAADYTVKEANKLTGIAKLKYKLSTTRARLANQYTEVGRLKYAESRGETFADDKYAPLFETIDSLTAEINAYEDELAKLKNVKICPACRAVIGLDMMFCPRCGAKQPEPEEPCDCGCCCEDEAEEPCDCNCDCSCEDKAEEPCDCNCDCSCEDNAEEPCDCGCEDKCDCNCEDKEDK